MARRATNRDRRRQRGVWEAWSIRDPNPKPECNANKDCPSLSMLSALPRTRSASPQKHRRQAEVWEECGQSGTQARNPNATRIRIVHRLSMLSALPRTPSSRTLRETEKNGTQENKPPKSCSPAADADENGPSTIRSRRDSTRILTAERYSCWSIAGWTRSGCAARTGSNWRSASRSSPPTSIGSD